MSAVGSSRGAEPANYGVGTNSRQTASGPGSVSGHLESVHRSLQTPAATAYGCRTFSCTGSGCIVNPGFEAVDTADMPASPTYAGTQTVGPDWDLRSRLCRKAPPRRRLWDRTPRGKNGSEITLSGILENFSQPFFLLILLKADVRVKS